MEKSRVSGTACLESTEKSTKDKSPLWAAAIVDYQGEKVLEVDLFDHKGTLMLRHWVAPGCEKYISLRVRQNIWSMGLLGNQSPLKNAGSAYYGFIEQKPKQNDEADSVLVKWDNSLRSSWRNPLVALNDKESSASSIKRWNSRTARDKQAMELFEELRPEDLTPAPIAEAMARKQMVNHTIKCNSLEK